MSAVGNFFEDDDAVRGFDYIPDSRTTGQKVGDWLQLPENHIKVLFAYAAIFILFAPLWPLILLVAAFHHFIYFTTPKHACLRYPKDLGGRDPSLDNKNAAGVYFIGWERSRKFWKHGRELWLTADDIGVHQVIMGTTGSGKTQFLLSVQVWNALCASSGVLYVDGKADNELPVKIWALCRRHGLEDQFLTINYLLGGHDPFSPNPHPRIYKTNKANMFAEAPMDFLSELLTSMLPKAEGDAATWQQKAINMMKAVVRIACFLRSRGELEVSVQTLRDFMALPRLIKIFRDAANNPGKYPVDAISAVQTYLTTGISWSPSGTEPAKRWKFAALDDTEEFQEKISDQTQTQHGYLTNQFLAPLSMLADTYGHIFRDTYPEVDMADVMLRRRVLTVLIPTLEKSPQEAGNLGKLLVGAMKLMMGNNLGHRIEGTYLDIIKNKATNARARFSVVLDELGSYFAPGLDTILSQSRSLGQAVSISGQDFFAMKKEGKDEVYTAIANTKVKICLALEDPTETFEIYQKAAGQMVVNRMSGREIENTSTLSAKWRSGKSTQVEKINKVEFEEVKALKPGEGILIFLDRVIRFKSLYIFDHINPDIKMRYKLNKFLQIRPAKWEELTPLLVPRDEMEDHPKTSAERIDMLTARLNEVTRPFYQPGNASKLMLLGGRAGKLSKTAYPTSVHGAFIFVAICRSLGRMDLFKNPDEKESKGTTTEGEAGGGSFAHKPDAKAMEQSAALGASMIDDLLLNDLTDDVLEPTADAEERLISDESHIMDAPVRVSSFLFTDGTLESPAGGVPPKVAEGSATAASIFESQERTPSGVDLHRKNMMEALRGRVSQFTMGDELGDQAEQNARMIDQASEIMQAHLSAVEEEPLDQVFTSEVTESDATIVPGESGYDGFEDPDMGKSGSTEFADDAGLVGFETSAVSVLPALAETNADYDAITNAGSIIDEIPPMALTEETIQQIEKIESILNPQTDNTARVESVKEFVATTSIHINREQTNRMIDNSLQAVNAEDVSVDDFVNEVFGDLDKTD